MVLEKNELPCIKRLFAVSEIAVINSTSQPTSPMKEVYQDEYYKRSHSLYTGLEKENSSFIFLIFIFNGKYMSPRQGNAQQASPDDRLFWSNGRIQNFRGYSGAVLSRFWKCKGIGDYISVRVGCCAILWPEFFLQESQWVTTWLHDHMSTPGKGQA